MADVADRAGVNKGTVSRALRGDRRISPATRERVWNAAKELGYKLDAVASGLSSRHTGVIGVVLERMDAPWTGEFLSAAGAVLLRCKMELLLMEGGSGAGFAANVMRRIEGRKADGLIWLGDGPLGIALDIPVIRVGQIDNGKEYHVGFERRDVLNRVRSLADGRRIIYRGGEFAAMNFLSCLEKNRGKGEKFVIWDGLRALPEGERPSLICGDETLARWLGVPYLRFPVRELGILSARVLTNVIRDIGVRPSVTLVKVPLISATGELLL